MKYPRYGVFCRIAFFMRRGARGNYAADAASLPARPAHEQETKSLLLLDPQYSVNAPVAEHFTSEMLSCPDMRTEMAAECGPICTVPHREHGRTAFILSSVPWQA